MRVERAHRQHRARPAARAAHRQLWGPFFAPSVGRRSTISASRAASLILADSPCQGASNALSLASIWRADQENSARDCHGGSRPAPVAGKKNRARDFKFRSIHLVALEPSFPTVPLVFKISQSRPRTNGIRLTVSIGRRLPVSHKVQCPG